MPESQGMREVCAEQQRALEQYASELNTLISGDQAKLNGTAKSLDIPNIIVSTPEEKAAKKPK